MKRFVCVLISGLLLLAACGPADVETAANEAASAAGGVTASDIAAAASAAANDPNVQAAASAAANDPDVQAAASEVAAAIEGLIGSEPLRLQSDQPLVLSTASEVAGVSNYRWIIADAPAGAESVEGQVISENSNGKLTVEPADYAKYFPASGDYTINLELTLSDGTKQVQPIPLVVP